MTQLEEYGVSHENAMRDIRFRVNEISEWIRDFIRAGDAENAARFARCSYSTARQLDEFPFKEEN